MLLLLLWKLSRALTTYTSRQNIGENGVQKEKNRPHASCLPGNLLEQQHFGCSIRPWLCLIELPSPLFSTYDVEQNEKMFSSEKPRNIADTLVEIHDVDKQQLIEAEYFEAWIYHEANSEDDYLRKIYLALLPLNRRMEDTTQVDPSMSNSACRSHLSSNGATPCFQPQIGTQEQLVSPQELHNSTSTVQVKGAVGLPFNTESTSNSQNLFEQRQIQRREQQSLDVSLHQKQYLRQSYYSYQQPSHVQPPVQQQIQQQSQDALMPAWSYLHHGNFNTDQLDYLNPDQPSGISVLHQLPPTAPRQHKPISKFQHPTLTPQPHPCNMSYMPKVQQIQMGSSSTPPTMLASHDDTTLDLIEEIHLKIKKMKEIYYTDLLENLRNIAIKLNQLDGLPPHQKHPNLRRKLIESRDFVEHALSHLVIPKRYIRAQLKEKLIVMEKHIRAYLELWADNSKTSTQSLGQKKSGYPYGNVELAKQQQLPGASIAQIGHHANQARKRNLQGSSISSPAQVVASTRLPSGAQLGIPNEHCQPIDFSHQGCMGSIQNTNPGIYEKNSSRQSSSSVNPFQVSARAIRPIAHQMSTEANDLKTKRDSGYCQKQFSGVQPNHALQLTGVDSVHVSSPQKLQASSMQISQPSLGNDSIKLVPVLLDDRISQPVDSLTAMKTPSIPSVSMESEQQQLSGMLSPSNSGHNGLRQTTLASVQPKVHVVGKSATPASSMIVEYSGSDSDQVQETTGKSSKRKRPIEALIDAVQSATPEVLAAAVRDIASVTDLNIMSSSAPWNGPKFAVGEYLVDWRKTFVSTENYGAEVGSSRKKIRRYISSMLFTDVPLTCGTNGRFNQVDGVDAYELAAAAPSTGQCQANQVTSFVPQEIEEINKRLIDTVVSVSEEEVDRIAAQAVELEGVVVSFAFTAVSISPSLISKLGLQHKTPIISLRLLVPHDYPKSSPVLLDELPDEQSKESDNLPSKAMSKFNKSLQLVSQPISLGKMAKLWDASIRELILEYAHQYGGGTFSSRVACWQSCVD